jgi:hypothetical protein
VRRPPHHDDRDVRGEVAPRIETNGAAIASDETSRASRVTPFTRLRGVAVVVCIYAAALVAWLVTGGRWGGRWFGVHVFTLGIVTNLVLALSAHFARTLAHAGEDGPRGQLAVTNAGIVVLLWAIPRAADPWIAAGATVLAFEVMRSYLLLRRLRARSLGGRWSWLIGSYEAAHAAFVLGAILGAAMGTGLLRGSWWASAREAHLHVNVLGWAGLTLLATIVLFGPTVLRTRMQPGADARAAGALPVAATALAVAVACVFASGAGGPLSVASRWAAAGALLVYGGAVVAIGRPLVRSAVRAQPSAARSAIPMVVGWFAVAVGLDAVVVGTASWRYTDAVGLLMLGGVLFQAIAASLGYLAPLMSRRGPTARAAMLARIDVFAIGRTALLNVGVAAASTAAALGPGDEAKCLLARAGFAMIVLAAVWLAATIALPAPTATRG